MSCYYLQILSKEKEIAPNTYLFVRLQQFIINWIIEAKNKNFINWEFMRNFNRFFSFLLKFWKVKWQVKLSEWYQNLLEDIVISFKNSTFSAWETFTLGTLYRKLESYLRTTWRILFDLY